MNNRQKKYFSELNEMMSNPFSPEKMRAFYMRNNDILNRDFLERIASCSDSHLGEIYKRHNNGRRKN